MTTHLMAVKTRGNHTSENYRPTEDEPFMSNRQRAYFRSKLLSDGGMRSFARRRRRQGRDAAQILRASPGPRRSRSRPGALRGKLIGSPVSSQ